MYYHVRYVQSRPMLFFCMHSAINPVIGDTKHSSSVSSGLLCIQPNDDWSWFYDYTPDVLDDTQVRFFTISWTDTEIQISNESTVLFNRSFQCPLDVRYIGVASEFSKFDVRWTTCALDGKCFIILVVNDDE